MNREINKKPFLVFNLLVVYVLVQLAWWGYLIVRLMHEVYGDTPAYRSKFLMIVGEGTVFLVLLIIGMVITRKSFIREINLNRQQRNFLLSVTHELKTPLSSTRLVLETLESRDLSDEKKKDLLRRALQDNARLSGLIENILLSAQFEQPGFRLYKENIDLSDLVNRTVDHLQSTIGSGHKLVKKIEPGLRVNADSQLFTSVVSNLFENAVKYSESGTVIEVILENRATKLFFAVRDQGVGVDPAQREKIFEKFYRLQDENTRSVKGTGLGLFLTRSICDLHHFSMDVKENHPKGSSFEVTMPV